VKIQQGDKPAFQSRLFQNFSFWNKLNHLQNPCYPQTKKSTVLFVMDNPAHTPHPCAVPAVCRPWSLLREALIRAAKTS
jgi:hypothetical protein